MCICACLHKCAHARACVHTHKHERVYARARSLSQATWTPARADDSTAGSMRMLSLIIILPFARTGALPFPLPPPPPPASHREEAARFERKSGGCGGCRREAMTATHRSSCPARRSACPSPAIYMGDLPSSSGVSSRGACPAEGGVVAAR